MFLPQILNPLINNIQMDSQSWTTLFLIPVILVASMPSPASFFHQPTLAEPAQPARGVGTDFPCSLPSGYSELPSPLTCQELAQAHSLREFQLSLGPHCSHTIRSGILLLISTHTSVVTSKVVCFLVQFSYHP